MKILYASSEVVPFAKTGGLADVAGALPKSLEKLGNDARVVMPKYKMIDAKKFGLKKIVFDLAVPVLNSVEKCTVFETKIPDSKVTVYFIANDKYFDRDGLYQDKDADYPDNCERFSFFCRAVCEFINNYSWKPEIVHCNDWQTALVIPLIKIKYQWHDIKTIYSVHNMGYLGLFPKDQIFLTGFGWEMFTPEKLEFFDKLSLAKAGFVYADVISTVSETYAREIQTPEFGYGLDGLLRFRKNDVYGILNGIDYDLWNPVKDKFIAKRYGIKSIKLKYENKKALQKANKLPIKAFVPVIGMITRLADQKGFDIFSQALEKIMHLNCQIVILGTGEPKYHELLKKIKLQYPEHIGLNLGFDSALAQLIYAGSDMFLMPSHYEPCGLGQLISFKYGTIPIVRKTGGLADTVHNFNPKKDSGDGFVFEEYKAEVLLDAVTRAINAFKKKKQWLELIETVMGYDYSWETSAKKYVELYRLAFEKR
ncbi:glycogen synthase GlgA [Candidatus Saganbacteria bacterium]|nr:glycogen synthase GlgA [Candidatus Saganbacteria bacterium]